jgi:uroporphyrinogen-III synthase
MRLIITRPEEDAEPLAIKLQRLGHDGVVLPLLQIKPRKNITIPERPWQAACFTSANALRAIPYPDSLKSIPAYTVGPQSVSEARHQGFSRATAHGGDVNGLSAYIVSHLKPDNGPIIYLSGNETSADLAGKLKSKGFKVHREIVYDAQPSVPEDLATELPGADGVLLYSPRTTKLWLAALAATSLVDRAAAITHYCLSANVAAALPSHFQRRVAGSPDESGMLTMLDHGTEAE